MSVPRRMIFVRILSLRLIRDQPGRLHKPGKRPKSASNPIGDIAMDNDLPATQPRLAARKVHVHALDHNIPSQLVHA